MPGRDAEKIIRGGCRAAEEALGENITATFEEKLGIFIGELVTWGERLHLIGKRRLEKTVADQIFDSIFLLKEVEDLAGGTDGGEPRIADIGSGAGFPGLVWKMARPRCRVVLFERRSKPALFLARTARMLALEGLSVEQEDASRYKGTPFDLVVSKAAGRLGEMFPVARAILRPGGLYVTVKGDGWTKELEEAGSEGFRLLRSKGMGRDRGTVLAFERVSAG
jgi:16S rRNA (guanine527-N7)-methyltransferase